MPSRSPSSTRKSSCVACSPAVNQSAAGVNSSDGSKVACGVGAEKDVDVCWSKSQHAHAPAAVGEGPRLPSSPRVGLQEKEAGLVWRGGPLPSSRPASPAAYLPLSRSLAASSASGHRFFLTRRTLGLKHINCPLFRLADVQRWGDFEGAHSSLEKRSVVEDLQTGSYLDYRRSLVIGQFAKETVIEDYSSAFSSEHSCEKRTNLSTAKVFAHERETSAFTRQHSKSLERQSLTNLSPTPDLLNFKKGWMTRLGEDGKWRKHWFVLADQCLRFYRDAVAEEAADLDGEIDLSSCYEITDFPVQKNYAFQIHTEEGDFVLCAMTYGIRRNWIQAVVNNVCPAVTPDVTRSVAQKGSSGAGHKSPSPLDNSQPEKGSRITQMRKDGRYNTFDWAEFSHRQQKREECSRRAGKGLACFHRETVRSVPSSPEEPIGSLIRRDQSETTCIQKEDRLRARNTTRPANTPNSTSLSTATSSYAASRPSGEETGCVDARTEWEEELQTVCRDLKAELDRSGREFRDFKARLQAELCDSQDRLRETEVRLRESEACLQEREGLLAGVQRHLEEVTGCLRATEEAQVLKDIRLQRQLRLLQESQEQERRSLGDSLDQSDRRVQELEERLRQREAELQSALVRTEELQRRCQELQAQLEECDGELGQLQARLRGEEALYYNLEHNYERVHEELESVRGALCDCERVCEDRYGAQLDRKEQELQEMTLRMATLGLTLQETELKLEQAQHQLQEDLVTQDAPAEPQSMLGSPDIGQTTTTHALANSGRRKGTRDDDSQRAMRALESKLCDTEEKLWEMTLQHQELGDEEARVLRTPATPLSGHLPGRGLEKLHCRAFCGLQGVPLESTPKERATNADVVMSSGLLDHDCEDPDRRGGSGMAASTLALVIQRMASALEHPSRELQDKLSELQHEAHNLREACCGTREVRTRERLAQIFAFCRELDKINGTLGDSEICSLCVTAELAYLIHVLYTRSSEASPVTLCSETYSNSKPRRAPASPSDLASPGQRHSMGTGHAGLQGGNRERLVAELNSQARTLQALSVQLQPAVLPPPMLRVALIQAMLVYVVNRTRMAVQQECSAECCRAVALFHQQARCYEQKQRESQQAADRAKANAQARGQEVRRLEAELDDKLCGLQQIHEEEMGRLHGYYSRSCSGETASTGRDTCVVAYQDGIQQLEDQLGRMEKDLLSSEDASLRQTYEQELETLKATCEQGFRTMEQSHQRVIEELERRHQMEVERLKEERERALQEEAEATITAIEAIHKAHKKELERSQKSEANADLSKLGQQCTEEVESLHRELEVLSRQYSQKCLENAHLKRSMEMERQALISCRRENQDLHTHNQELSKRVLSELTLMQSSVTGGMDLTPLSQNKDVYQLQVTLRVKESEIRCLKQEILSLKEELQATHRHSKEVLGSRYPSDSEGHGYTPELKSRSNPDLVKHQVRRLRLDRSKVGAVLLLRAEVIYSHNLSVFTGEFFTSVCETRHKRDC
ncbi:adventurous-gliding motility protein Z [Electrophorus electricus]|uniref:adventurous-gliding motility protein Z n=1 Tax=Electrophorus electricus TaxID=8005 RepID=UPI0015D0B362|nr:adventurous-gliding motility protein Z [Electrophorus electricus]